MPVHALLSAVLLCAFRFPLRLPTAKGVGQDTGLAARAPQAPTDSMHIALHVKKIVGLKTEVIEAQISSSPPSCSCSPPYCTVWWHLLKWDCHSHWPVGEGLRPALISTGVFPDALPQVLHAMRQHDQKTN